MKTRIAKRTKRTAKRTKRTAKRTRRTTKRIAKRSTRRKTMRGGGKKYAKEVNELFADTGKSIEDKIKEARLIGIENLMASKSFTQGQKDKLNICHTNLPLQTHVPSDNVLYGGANNEYKDAYIMERLIKELGKPDPNCDNVAKLGLAKLFNSSHIKPKVKDVYENYKYIAMQLNEKNLDSNRYNFDLVEDELPTTEITKLQEKLQEKLLRNDELLKNIKKKWIKNENDLLEIYRLSEDNDRIRKIMHQKAFNPLDSAAEEEEDERFREESARERERMLPNLIRELGEKANYKPLNASKEQIRNLAVVGSSK